MKGAGTNIVFILTSSVIGVVIIEGSGIGSFGQKKIIIKPKKIKLRMWKEKTKIHIITTSQ